MRLTEYGDREPIILATTKGRIGLNRPLVEIDATNGRATCLALARRCWLKWIWATHYLFARGAWVSGLVGVVLSLVFAWVSSIHVEHACASVVTLQRAAAVAQIETEIGDAEQQAREAQLALVSLPASIPGSRLLILQAPLRERIAAAEANRDELHAQLRAVVAERPADRTMAMIMALLAFAEPVLYWILAASQSQSRLPSQQNDGGPRGPRPASRRDGAEKRERGAPAASLLSAAVLALAPIMPGAARPQAQPPTPLAVDASPPAPGRPIGAFRTRRGPCPAALRASPPWLAQATMLRGTGLSYRKIARAVAAPKSTVARWLKPT